ncbi:hypothetical protein Q8A73_013316 [Channa argus]|nr:hypothetical protein Q8A73_013316 [Channa argus]
MDQPLPPPIVTNQPRISVVEPRTGTWSSGVFDCWDDTEICCLGFWCGPCLACKVAEVFGECLCLPLLNVLSGGFPLFCVTIRSSMRERYHIKGSIFEDWVLASFCTLCSLCQLAREMKLHNPESF